MLATFKESCTSVCHVTAATPAYALTRLEFEFVLACQVSRSYAGRRVAPVNRQTALSHGG